MSLCLFLSGSFSVRVGFVLRCVFGYFCHMDVFGTEEGVAHFIINAGCLEQDLLSEGR